MKKVGDKLTVDQLELGDVVTFFDGPFNYCIVTRIDELDGVNLDRPHAQQFGLQSLAGCSIGIERIHCHPNSTLVFEWHDNRHYDIT